MKLFKYVKPEISVYSIDNEEYCKGPLTYSDTPVGPYNIYRSKSMGQYNEEFDLEEEDEEENEDNLFHAENRKLFW